MYFPSSLGMLNFAVFSRVASFMADFTWAYCREFRGKEGIVCIFREIESMCVIMRFHVFKFGQNSRKLIPQMLR